MENTLPPAPTQDHTTQKVDAQTQSEDAGIPSSPPQLKELYIDNIPDHQLSDFVRTRQLQLHFPTGRLWDESPGSWTMKCVGEETHMFYLISKDPMTQYLLRIGKSFCNDNFRINFLLFFLTSDRTMIERSLSI